MPANSLAEFIAYAKQKPKQVTFSSAGIGTTQHLGGELFELMTGTQLVHVPYKGSGPAMTDLLGGQGAADLRNRPGDRALPEESGSCASSPTPTRRVPR